MLDRDEADDKIIAVLKDDTTYGCYTDIQDVPDAILERLRHYFLTYKQAPGSEGSTCQITHTYGRNEARQVIERSIADYKQRFEDLEAILTGALSVMR